MRGLPLTVACQAGGVAAGCVLLVLLLVGWKNCVSVGSTKLENLLSVWVFARAQVGSANRARLAQPLRYLTVV